MNRGVPRTPLFILINFYSEKGNLCQLNESELNSARTITTSLISHQSVLCGR